ncbi:TldD protein, part of TldE/TldD proteolytic complex [hydrothermal vent metagenome]|uniref:TldD protein, part of TldE/TldD proteolytic complex n=1 Tax=hydrothermal vent metagenome TaxID=652676 RepID=A0A3B1A5M0_9ZZZZ
MVSNSVERVSQLLLEPTGLTHNDLQSTLDLIMQNSIDSADIYCQSSQHESWILEDGIIKEGSFNIDQGVGIRAVSGEKTGFAYSDEIVLPALTYAANAAKAISSSGQQGSVQSWKAQGQNTLYIQDNPLQSLHSNDKVELLNNIDKHVRKMDPRITQVSVSLSGVHEVVLVAASDGTFNSDIRPLVRLSVSVIVESKGRREQGSSGGGGRVDYSYFTNERALGYAKEAVRQALVNLEAIDAPAGEMVVVLGPGWPGVLLHEAIGHGLEADFNRKGSSAFTGMIGEKVASELCTIVDNGSLENRRGSLNIDDEGIATQNTVLIEKGILKAYMQDKLNAKLMKSAPTGNGRRESYAHLPMPRMTNTYMLAGKHDPNEIIASVDKGIYAVNFGGGQVDITSGKFVFSANEAYLIENGKVTSPVKGATLIGNGPEILNYVSMVGNDLELDSGVGVCGKEGQSVAVGVGQPTLKIDKLTVGGVQ